MIRVKCPSCRKVLGIPETKAGAVGRCPACQHRFRFPSPQPAEVDEEEAAPEDEDQDEEEAPPRRRRKRKSRRRSARTERGSGGISAHGIIFGTLFGGLGLIMLCGGIVALVGGGQRNEPYVIGAPLAGIGLLFRAFFYFRNSSS